MAAALKALLVGNYREDGQHSMLGFGAALRGSLPHRGIAVEFIAPKRILRSPSRRLDKWCAYFDKYVLFPIALRRAARRSDLVHLLDQGNGIYVNHLQGVRHVVTCHDLLAIRSALGELPYWQTGRPGRIYQGAILRGLRRAKFVVCVSRATLCDAQRLLHLSDDRLTMILNGLYAEWKNCAGAPPPKACLKAKLGAGRPYVLHVGSALPYKNRKGALALFAALRDRGGPSVLVLAGEPLSPSERAQAHLLSLSESIIELSRAAGPDLEWLYSNAWSLLVTSFDEGFGMPIIEAQACGCPVFVPPKDPMTEVGGGGVMTIDPAHPEAAARAIVNAMANVAQIQTLGYDNARKFSRDVMVTAYADLYKRLTESAPD